MPRLRLAVSVLLSLAAALLLSVPAAASAGTVADTITIISAGSPSDDPGLLSVNATASTPITSITVQLIPEGSSLSALTVTDFAYPPGQANGTWTVQAPIAEGQPPGQLPLGSYTISVTATDSGHGAGSNPDAGTLNFVNQPAITLSASPTTVDYAAADVTFSGSVVVTAPGGSQLPPAAYAIELINETTGHSYPVMTDSDGTYSYTLHQAPPGPYVAEVPATATLAQGTSGPVVIRAHMDPVQVSAKLSASTVRYGQLVSVKGTVAYTPLGATQPVPLADQTVAIYQNSISSNPAAQTVTGPQGQFSVQLPKSPSATWIVTAGGGVYLMPATVSLPLHVVQPTAISAFTVSLNPYAVLSVSGCLGVQDDPGAVLPAHPNIEIQYSRSASGPWSSLRSTRSTQASGCNGSARNIAFTATSSARLARAYYRAEFGGTSAFEPSASDSLLRWKYLTKITSFRVSPRTARVNQKVTASGRVWYYGSSWRPLAHQPVMIIFRYKKRWYYYPHLPRTNSAGRFSGQFKVYVSAPWAAQYNGDSKHFASASALVKLTATGHVRLTLIRPGPAIPTARARRAGRLF
ncbi:MAG: hypothetical protein ACLPUO_19910 [Streptosporangiaceae bacterium]